MIDLKLFTNDGKYVATVQVPPWKYPPELYQWGDRFFILRYPNSQSPQYSEAAGFYVVPPATETVTEQ